MDASRPFLRDLRVPQVVENLEGIMDGFRAYKAMEAALDLELFELLDREPGLDREDIAKRLGINGMFIRSFLLSLADIGLVSQEDESYFNTETAERFLVRRSPLYQGDWIEADTGKGSRWSGLAMELRRDKPEAYAFDQAPRTDFIRALGQRSLRGELQYVAKAVAAWEGFPGARLMLDIGGGHGLYSIALCQLNPDLRGVVFDKPHVVPETQRFLDDFGMSDRLKAVGGDIRTDDMGEGYDMVLACHVLYPFRKDMPGFLAKARRALKPGGLLLSNHWFCAPGCVPTQGLKEMDKSFLSFGHPLCHIEKFNDLLAECGFQVLAAKEVSSTFGTANLHIMAKAEDPARRAETRAEACCAR